MLVIVLAWGGFAVGTGRGFWRRGLLDHRLLLILLLFLLLCCGRVGLLSRLTWLVGRQLLGLISLGDLVGRLLLLLLRCGLLAHI
jgi:hypothetical protein